MKDRMKRIEDWANYVRSSNGEWKIFHTEFINAQYHKVYAFIDRLAKQPGGKEKIIELYGIKNPKAFPRLFKSN